VNLAFSVRPDGGETGVLVVSQQTIRQRQTSVRRYKAGTLKESGADRPFCFFGYGVWRSVTPPAFWQGMKWTN